MLTARQKELLDFIRHHYVDHGVAPSQQEMADHLGLASRGRVNGMIKELVARGFIRHIPYKSRAIELVEPAVEIMSTALREIQNAYDLGPNWFTDGVDGQRRHIFMWLQKGNAAAKAIKENTHG